MPTDVMTFDRADLADSGGSKKEAKSTHAKPQESGWTRGEKTRPILHDFIYDRRELAEQARQEETSPGHIRSQIIVFSESKKNFIVPAYDSHQTSNGSCPDGVTPNNTSGDVLSAPTTLNYE